MTDVQHVEVGAAAETTITVCCTAATGDRLQGLVVEADTELEVNGVSATRVVLWSHRSPDDVEILTSAAGSVRFWNVWLDGDLLQSWQGDARIEVDDEGEDLGLSSYDGHGGDVPDLVVRLSFDRAWTQPSTE